jgi:two-component system cell cycle response regulator CtrA
MKALIIEDEPLYAKRIAQTLWQHGINSDICHKAEDGLCMAEACEYDVMIVDACLPDRSGNELIQEIRTSNKHNKKNVPIIVLSNLEKSEDKVEAFIHGADDFIQKPYESKEFIMRILTAIRRCNGHSENKIRIGEISLNLKERSVYVNDKKLKFSGKEYQLFQLLIMKKQNTLSKQEILDALYYGEGVPGMKIVDVLICKIRKEIAKYTKVQYLETVWGMGYMIRGPQQEDEDIAVVQVGTAG